MSECMHRCSTCGALWDARTNHVCEEREPALHSISGGITWPDPRVADLERQVTELRSWRIEQDCRYTMGDVADASGSHCPIDKPCARCCGERVREALVALLVAAQCSVEAMRSADANAADQRWRAAHRLEAEVAAAEKALGAR